MLNTTEFWSWLSRPNKVKFCLGRLSPMQSNLGRGELNRILPNFVQDQLGQILIGTDLTEFGLIRPNFV